MVKNNKLFDTGWLAGVSGSGSFLVQIVRKRFPGGGFTDYWIEWRRDRGLVIVSYRPARFKRWLHAWDRASAVDILGIAPEGR